MSRRIPALLAVCTLAAAAVAGERPVSTTLLWATENSREATVAAFKRREVYATTGPRIRLRFFGGHGFDGTDAAAGDIAVPGYAREVPMGGDLPATGRPPSFLVAAMKDPFEANFDRVQIVKGWLDKDGQGHEKIYEVAWSGERRLGADGRLDPVGNTVDLSTGKYTNDIGSASLATRWIDPDFDPSQPAFYYARVLQIPTPRHSLLDAIALGIDVIETGRPATIQERAYPSPNWYSPW